jgi:pimeloyl-ACP methyl ester carboxylesterase
MDFIEANGVGLRCELSGGGDRTLVLVHEMGGSLESWDDVAPQFAKSRRVLRYDTRGAGLSQKVRGELTLDTMADDIAALLDQFGIAGKVALAGVAVGGAIALQFARLACPVLVIGGSLDRVRPPPLAEAVAKSIPGARYVEIRTGHYMSVQTPDLLSDCIEEFLRSVDA